MNEQMNNGFIPEQPAPSGLHQIAEELLETDWILKDPEYLILGTKRASTYNERFPGSLDLSDVRSLIRSQVRRNLPETVAWMITTDNPLLDKLRDIEKRFLLDSMIEGDFSKRATYAADRTLQTLYFGGDEEQVQEERADDFYIQRDTRLRDYQRRLREFDPKEQAEVIEERKRRNAEIEAEIRAEEAARENQ